MDLAMATTAAASTLALLVLYGAALIFLLQTISDRYTPTIFGQLLRRNALGWAISLGVLALASFVLIGLPVASVTREIVATSLLVAGIAVCGAACYRTWMIGTDRDQVFRAVRHLRPDRRPSVVQEIAWSAIGRSDLETLRLAAQTFPYGSSSQVDLIMWILGHHPLENREWLVSELLRALFQAELDSAVAASIDDPVVTLLNETLGRDDYKNAYDITDRTMRAIRSAPEFGRDHGQLMLDVGRSIWRVGDSTGDVARVASIPGRLEFLKTIYYVRRRDIYNELLNRGDAAAMTIYVAFLCLMVDDNNEDDDAYSHLYDIAVDAHQAKVLSPEAIQDLGNLAGHIRRRVLSDSEDKAKDAWWDAEAWDGLIVKLVVAQIELGVSDGDIRHMLANYGYFSRGMRFLAPLEAAELPHDTATRLAEIFSGRRMVPPP